MQVSIQSAEDNLKTFVKVVTQTTYKPDPGRQNVRKYVFLTNKIENFPDKNVKAKYKRGSNANEGN